MTIHQLKPQTAYDWITSGEAVLLDVREPQEYAAMHIEQARLQPLSTVTMDNAHLPEHRDKKLIIHCRSGKRSMMACEKLQAELPKQDFYNLDGGIMAWSANHLPTASSKTDYVLDKRGQLAIGGICLLGIVLSQHVSPDFMLITAVASTALVIDGLTGMGALARLFSAKAIREKN